MLHYVIPFSDFSDNCDTLNANVAYSQNGVSNVKCMIGLIISRNL